MLKTHNALAWCALLYCFSFNANAQNLVPNSDFEIGSCPTNQAWIDAAGVNVPPWGSANTATTDYFSACGIVGLQPLNNGWGIRTPRSGDDFIGIYIKESANPNKREYLQVKLTSPLVAGYIYNIGFYLIVSDGRYVTDDVGLYISTVPPTRADNLVMSFTPQITSSGVVSDKLNWTLVSGNYTASGGEEYITIGCFVDDATITVVDLGAGINMMYYFVEDPFVIKVGGLPVEMEEFSVQNGPYSTVLCKWSTHSEKDNDYFEVERSRDGLTYKVVNRVEGSGNSNFELNYIAYDENPLEGLVYYRLKQVDFNGDIKYYDPVSYNSGEVEFKPSLYPNPFIDEFTIDVQSEERVDVILMNMMGEVVYKNAQKGLSKIHVNSIDNLPPGNYILKVIKDDEQFIEKIVKE